MTDDRSALVDRESQADLLRFIAEGTAGVIGEEFFRSLVRHLAAAFDVESAFVAERVEEPESVRLISCWHEGRFVQDDQLLEPFRDDGRWSLSIAILGADGRALGHIGVVHTQRLEATPAQLATLEIFAARAGAELERRRNEEALRRLADAQAALRRVATLVASGAPARELLEAVTSEAGRLLDAQFSSTLRYDDGGATVMGGWARDGDPVIEIARPRRPDRSGHRGRLSGLARPGVDAGADGVGQARGRMADHERHRSQARRLRPR